MGWVDTLVSSFEKGDVSLIVFVLTLALVINYKHLLTAFDEIRQRKVKSVAKLMDQQALSPSMKTLLADQLDNAVFTATTGIRCEKFFREAIMTLYEKAHGRFSYRQLGLIDEYLRFEDGKVMVELDKFEWTVFVFNAFNSLFVFLYAIYLVQVMFVGHDALSWAQMFYIGGIVGGLYVVGLYLLLQTVKFVLARRIRNIFLELQKEHD